MPQPVCGVDGIKDQGMMRHRNSTIDILRFLFAVIIVLHHSRYVLGYEDSIFIGGSLAVEFYFIVSGYLMMAHLEKAAQTGTAGRSRSVLAGGSCPDPGTDRSDRNNPGEGSNRSGIIDPGKGIDRSERVNRREGAVSEGIGTETFRFILGKIRAFLPEFIIALLIGSLFVGLTEHWTLRNLLGHVVHGFGEYTLLKMSGIYQSGIDGVMWYLSAMLLAMAVLYPLIRRFPDMMKHIGLPLITILIFGYLCQTSGTPRDPTQWEGIAYRGLLRAAAEVSLGCICFLACRRLRQYHFNRFGSTLLLLSEFLCYLIPVWYMYKSKPGAEDYFYIFLLFLGIMLSFAIPECTGKTVAAVNGRTAAAGPEDPLQHWQQGPENAKDNSARDKSAKVSSTKDKSAGANSARDSSAKDKSANNKGTKDKSTNNKGTKDKSSSGEITGRRRTVTERFGSFCAKYSTALFLAHLYFAQHINSVFPEETYSAGFRMAWYLGLSFANGLVVMLLAGLVRRHGSGIRGTLKHLLLKPQEK